LILNSRFEAGIHTVTHAKGIPFRFNRTDSMAFTDREIVNVDDMMKQDLELFIKFLWGCLDNGIYLDPSPYETGFLGLAHNEADPDDTVSVFDEVLAGF
jgi:glutamate-1-semialdehyde 2,1-aminomutase